jgi:hypothetical protein
VRLHTIFISFLRTASFSVSDLEEADVATVIFGCLGVFVSVGGLNCVVFNATDCYPKGDAFVSRIMHDIFTRLKKVEDIAPQTLIPSNEKNFCKCN